MFMILAALQLELMPLRQQQCYLYPYLNKRGMVYYCDFLGQRLDYA